MKLHATATTAFFPAALAAASISLALRLLPSAPVSSGAEHGHEKALGRPADVPPAVPPGQAKKAPGADKHAPRGRGGGE